MGKNGRVGELEVGAKNRYRKSSARQTAEGTVNWTVTELRLSKKRRADSQREVLLISASKPAVGSRNELRQKISQDMVGERSVTRLLGNSPSKLNRDANARI
jgi:hypothetical protein